MKIDIIIYSFVLVLIPLFISYKHRLYIEKELFINSIRALIQLTLLGFILGILFKIKNPIFYIPVILFMLLYSSYIAKKRTGFLFSSAFYSISLSTIIILTTMLLLKIISFKPYEFIPISGMIIGNSLNTYTLTIERLKREITLQKELIESFIAIGDTLQNALKIMQKQAVKAALIPVNNMLQTIGVVAIPGITTGMLLAGASPLKAVSYQIVIIYMLVSINTFSALFGSYFFIKVKNEAFN
ncbi:putative ABC transport system permease protein [Lebetimonas natsushimae]|uniref:Putative ABC transport system permease protein n=1 Tax=Lebetimonas natsushimae TaxID=1936991 RepID=A0A292YGL6_9BACT|nr:iron export ABC transporter permease subunit FetB [Lebetimonas natsushimae]GAX88159.1 putative ABC transport system permease protein [Lebetimonas natsushimae]